MTSSRTRSFVATAACLIFSLVTVAGSEPAARKGHGLWAFELRAEGEIRYDDNILSLSEREKDDLKDPALRNSSRFKIESADDVILAPDLSFSFSRSPRRGRDTDITFEASVRDYTRNSVKDWQEYALSVRQELNRSRAHRTHLTVGGSWLPEYYLRQLVDDDESQAAGTTIRNAADYEMSSGFLELSQEIVNRTLSVSGRYTRERRNYNDHFDERDSSSDVLRFAVDVFPLRDLGFRVRPYYQRETRESRGDLATSAVVDDDVGFDGDLLGVSLRGLWGRDSDHRHTVRGWYENEKRTFTTSSTSDPGHFDRDDDITQFGAGYEKELGPRWRVGGSYRHRVNDVSRPAAGGRTVTSFTKNVLAASLVYRFDRPLGRGQAGTKKPPAPESANPTTDED